MDAGIYMFKNKINGKCYIGQAQSLKKRINHHYSNIKTQRYNLPIYKAINKYGIENFDLIILKEYPQDIKKKILCNKMDEDEKYYIEKYNGYTNGYNCTLGGDGGILGYKMTDEQKDKIRRNSKRSIVNRKMVYMYNVKEKYYITAISVSVASTITGLSRSNIGRVANKTYTKNNIKYFLCSFSKEDLQDQIKSLSQDDINKILESNNNGKFKKGHKFSSGTRVRKRSLSESHKSKISKSLKSYSSIEIYDKQNVFIQSFNSKKDLSVYLNCSICNINDSLSGRIKTCKGYILKAIH